METDDIEHTCDMCRQSAPINPPKCPHCQVRQLTSLTNIGIVSVLGLAALPLSYVIIPFIRAQGLPGGVLEGIGMFLLLIIGIFGPLCLVAGLGAYFERWRAIRDAKRDE